MFAEQVVAAGLKFVGRCMNGDFLEGLLKTCAEDKRQAGHMIQVRMREQNIERLRGQEIANAEKAGTRIQHNAHFGQHQAGRVPPLARMIAAGAQEEQFHGTVLTQDAGLIQDAEPTRGAAYAMIIRGPATGDRELVASD